MLNKYLFAGIGLLILLLAGSGWALKSAWGKNAVLDTQVKQWQSVAAEKELEIERQKQSIITASRDKAAIRRKADIIRKQLLEALDEKNCANTAIGPAAFRVLKPADRN